MAVGGQSYTSTEEVTSYLVKHAPKPVKPGTSFIAKIHEDKYDPNFPLLLAVRIGQLGRPVTLNLSSAFRQRTPAKGSNFCS